MHRVALRFRLDFANGFSVGPRKVERLLAIDMLGSHAYEEADQYHREYASRHLKTLAAMLSAESRPAASKPPVGLVNPCRRGRPLLKTA